MFFKSKKVKELENKVEDLECTIKTAEKINEDLNNRIDELEEELTSVYEDLHKIGKEKEELEFCLNECKKENRNSVGFIKRTNLIKDQLLNMVLVKDKEGKMIVDEDGISVHKKLDGVKIYDLVRLLG